MLLREYILAKLERLEGASYDNAENAELNEDAFMMSEEKGVQDTIELTRQWLDDYYKELEG